MQSRMHEVMGTDAPFGLKHKAVVHQFTIPKDGNAIW